MSDEFDKEAEREKLREKYGDDAEERKATERMSDLLLKGATMTNSHCGTCGDPLFRQNGVTFCPSCHGGPEGVEGTGVEGAESQAEGQPQGQPPAEAGEATEIDVSSPDDELGGAEPANDPADRPEGPAPSETDERATPTRRNQSRAGASDPSQRVDRGGPRTAPSPDSSTPDRSGEPAAPTAPAADRVPAGGSEGNARESLIAALERFSAEAAATDDPRYARECLEAAREASEALAALR